MKNLLITLAFFSSSLIGAAQVKNITYSAPFAEPERGWYKVMQLSNGNTFYFNFNNENGVEVTVFNPDRKVGSKKILSSTLWDTKNMKNSVMEGLYEIAGQPVIFLQQLNDRTPELFRIQLNPENGAIVKEQRIGELPKYVRAPSYATTYWNLEPVDFIVEKDPYSNAYAIVCYNSLSEESDKRIELVHYTVENGEHIEINRANYDAQGFENTNYIGMTINGDRSVHLATYGFSGENRKKEVQDSRVVISRIKRGEKAFTNVNLEFTEDFKETEGLMNYNPETGLIQMMTLTLLKSKEKRSGFDNSTIITYYMALLCYIDPESLQIVKKVLLPYEGLMAYVSSKGVGDDEYSGMPVNMILNADNTTTILLEEKSEIPSGKGTQIIWLNRIGIVKMDNTGRDIESYAVYKNQKAEGPPLENMYLAKRGKGMWSYRRRNALKMSGNSDNRSFYSYDHINTSTNNTYIIFNDNAVNYDNNGVPRIWPNKIGKSVQEVSTATTVFRKINNKGMSAGFLFGGTYDRDHTAFCNIESAHYSKETGIYAALMVKRNKKEKKAYIAWVTFE